MSDRYDPNWGKHGNPYPRQWYHYGRSLRDMNGYGGYEPPTSDFIDNIFSNNGPKISVWTLIWIIGIFLILSALIPDLRNWVYSGINFTESWYDAVDSMLDALNVPKVPTLTK